MSTVIGLDIGGANLKAFHTNGIACLVPYELWKNPSELPNALRQLLAMLPPAKLLAVTMTGELCDCFETKRQGVLSILDGLAHAAGQISVSVWRNDSRRMDLESARRDPLPVAAANWLALASFAGRLTPRGSALLVDIGSTTTDIIPLHDGFPIPMGRTDVERMRTGELLYTGARRTPLCALLGERGAAEFFATTQDVYLLLGELPEDPNDLHTANGRPATQTHAHARLARMIGGDLECITFQEAVGLARQVAGRQRQLLAQAITKVANRLPGAPETIVLSGSGEFLALPVLSNQPALADCRLERFSQLFGEQTSAAACAYALSILASEQTSL